MKKRKKKGRCPKCGFSGVWDYDTKTCTHGCRWVNGKLVFAHELPLRGWGGSRRARAEEERATEELKRMFGAVE